MESFSVEITFIILCLILSALFSSSEAVVMSISVDRVSQLIDESGGKNKALKFLVSHPTEILTTILVWNNLVNSVVASLVTSISSKLFGDFALAIAAGVATMIILVFGEITPKVFARTNAENFVNPVAVFLRFFYLVFIPILLPLSVLIKKTLGKNAMLQGRVVTTDDIEYLVNKAEEDKSIDSKHIDLINSILEFPTIKVKDIMISRNKIDAIDIESDENTIQLFFKEKEHSRYPVYKSSLDQILGFIHVKDYYRIRDDGKIFDLTNVLKPPFFVYEQMRIQSVFDYMNRNKVHLSLVKDETGTVVGMVTLEDIMEEIFGEIHDEHDRDSHLSTMVKEIGGGLVVPGSTSLRDLLNEYEIDIPSSDSYSTVTGFILELLANHFPKHGQIIFWENYSFELSKVISYQIEEVTIKKVRSDDENAKMSSDEIKTENNSLNNNSNRLALSHDATGLSLRLGLMSKKS